MRSKLTWVVLFSAAIGVAAMFYVGKVSATPATGFKATTIATGTFDEINAFKPVFEERTSCRIRR